MVAQHSTAMRVPQVLHSILVAVALLAGAPTVASAQCADADVDGICDLADPCPNPDGLRLIYDARLTLSRFGFIANDDRIKLTGTAAFPGAADIDPITTGLRLLVTDGAGVTIVDQTLAPGWISPGTRTGWKAQRTGFVWRGRGALSRVLLKRDDPGHVRVIVVGGRGQFTAPTADPIRVTLVFTPPLGTTGACAEILFARTDPVIPRCLLTNGAHRLVCH
jgi:hypothetical protein